jgi:hypothetical protein
MAVPWTSVLTPPGPASGTGPAQALATRGMPRPGTLVSVSRNPHTAAAVRSGSQLLSRQQAGTAPTPATEWVGTG